MAKQVNQGSIPFTGGKCWVSKKLKKGCSLHPGFCPIGTSLFLGDKAIAA
jgi:hypothetical protein